MRCHQKHLRTLGGSESGAVFWESDIPKPGILPPPADGVNFQSGLSEDDGAPDLGNDGKLEQVKDPDDGPSEGAARSRS